MDVYKFKNYRELISALLTENPKSTRAQLAEAAQCSSSWITRVLTSEVQLTPDQALGIGNYYHLNTSEIDYFLLLVDWERSASVQMKKRIELKLEKLKKESRDLKTSLQAEDLISEKNSIKYYSSWAYMAAHVACMIKAQSSDELAELLSLSTASAARTIKELSQMGLLVASKNLWAASTRSVHLPSDHPSAKFAHIILRNKTSQYLQEIPSEGLHYSAVHCLSAEDFENIHKILKASILSARLKIEKSQSEVLSVFCLDWYRL